MNLVTYSQLQKELAVTEQTLSEYAENLSNLDELSKYAVVTCSQLGSLWETGDYEFKQELQNLVVYRSNCSLKNG